MFKTRFFLRTAFLALLAISLQACVSTGSSQGDFEAGRQSFIDGDYHRAFQYLEPLAQSGDPEAQYAVGYMYFYGLGTVQDRQLAYRWMSTAANNGDSQAIQALAGLPEEEFASLNTFPRQLPRGFVGPQHQPRSAYPGSSSGRSGGSGSGYSANPDSNTATEVQAAWPPPRDNSFANDSALQAPDNYQPPVAPSGSDSLEVPATSSPMSGPDLTQNNQQTPAQQLQQQLQVASHTDEGGAAGKAAAAPGKAIDFTAAAPAAAEQATAAAPPALAENTPAQPADNMRLVTPQGTQVNATPSAVNSNRVAAMADKYTVQLMGSRSPGKIQQFISQHQLQGKVQTVLTQHDGQDWYVLVYGSYPNVASAQQAISALPSSVQDGQPWVRNVSGLNASAGERHIG